VKRFTSLLVANRGEIAVRITRTAQRMGYRVIAVYSDADAGAPHTRIADQAVRIGAAAPRDSYLNIFAIIAAAHSSGAGAVHPGYGFLAENAGFAQAVVDAGLVWVGPPAAAMRAMGDKAQAKRLMRQAGVPCVPGYDNELQDDATLRAEAAAIGYPLMIKATQGGGGRGLRRVESAAVFDAALTSARSEAQSAFGAATVLLERALTKPRHVEIQVFADEHGHVVHLGERDCSVQRRHQKLIEEAPSPALAGAQGQALRRRMGAMAVAATHAIDYRGAGTIECLLDAQGDFYFMEMNTRLQVEHPVTEALTGYDLVEWQLRVAQGELLPETSQETILQRFETGGHAIELRLCAEDPAHDFLPQSGRLTAWSPGNAVRIDHALEAGMEITPYYDSMIAKFVAHATDREAACRQLAAALRQAVVLGVRTNQAFALACLEHADFANGSATTAFIGTHGDVLRAASPPLRASMAALMVYATRALRLGHDPVRVALALSWAVPMRFSIDGVAAMAQLQALGGGMYRILCGDLSEDLELIACGQDSARITAAKGHHTLSFAVDRERLLVSLAGRQSVIEDHSLAAAPGSGASAHSGLVRATMAGRVIALNVSEGQRVNKGTTMLVLEAMKMEHPSIAPMDAVVMRVCVVLGAQVTAASLMIDLTPIAPI
jgi:geranyl-CoA carboxylase alpha subunit